MSAQQVLNNFISTISSLFEDKSIAILNLDLEILFISKSSKIFFNMASFTNQRIDKIGQHDNNIAKLVLEFEKKLINRVMQTKKAYVGFFFLQMDRHKNCEIFNASVFPILHPLNNSLVGIYIEVKPIFDNREAFLKMLELITHHKNISEQISEDDKQKISTLTQREKIVIFMIMLGKGHKEIAESISNIYEKPILANSISALISKQIYPKLHVYSTSQLINLGIKLGFLYNLPEELVSHLPQIFYIIPFDKFNKSLRYRYI